MNKKYCSPLTVKLNKNLQLKTVYSVHDSTGLDISGCEFADLISLDTIITAPKHPEYGQINVITDSTILGAVRELTQDDQLSVLLLYLFNDKLVLFIDNDRELLLEILDL